MSWKGELLKGKASGASLFLAWSLGVVAVYLLNALITVLEVSHPDWSRFHAQLVSLSLMFFTIGQSVLLLPQLWRRILWILIYCVGAATIMLFAEPLATHPETIATITAVFQGCLFIGIRRRFWLWMLVLGLQWLLEFSLTEEFFELYGIFLSSFRAYLPAALSLGPEDVYRLVLIVMLGAVAAFFMPPIDPAQTTADARSRVKAEWREALAILTPILAVLLWLVYGHQFGLLRAARKARTREDVRNLRLKYPIVLSHAVENHVVGQADSRFGAYRYGFYRKEHAFTWRLDANYKVVAYERNSETFLFRFSLSDEEYR